MKLVCFDLDGVIFKHINFWLELHKKFGTYEEGKKLTEKHLYTDYKQLVIEVVERLWKGKDARPFFELIDELEYISGAKECINELKEHGLKTAIITSGERHAALRAQKDLGIDFIYSNELLIKDDKITGGFVWPIGADSKDIVLKELCEKLNISLKEVVFVGHAKNDIKIAKIAGLGFVIGFAPDKDFREVSDAVIEENDLWQVVKVLEERGFLS